MELSVPGAADAIRWIQEAAIPHRFLTNTTSRPRSAIVDKLGGLGVQTSQEQILTPPVAAADWLTRNAAAPAALFVAPATVAEFGGVPLAAPDATSVGAVVVGDYAERWDYGELNRAFRLLMAEPRPRLIALGMTRYWQAEDGLRLDTAPFVTALAHASGSEPLVLGKPAPAFFHAALAALDVDGTQALMVGDDIRGDVEGAQAAGLRAALVRTGKFRASDLATGVRPDLVLGSIADLPARLG